MMCLIKELPACPVTVPLCEATMGIFSRCTNTDFATFLLQTGGSPASLNTQQTFSFLITLLLLPLFCAFPIASFISHQLKTEPATLDLNFLPPDISRPKNLDKTRCPISALSVHWFQNLKPFCSQMRNDVASFIINVATFSRQSLSNCDAKPALLCLGLPCTRKKINLWDSSSPASGNERFFSSVNDLLSLQHLSLLGQNFYTPPTNMHCHQPVSAYFSCLSNRW